MTKVLYNPQRSDHFGRTPVRDERDGRLYIEDCITWFVKKGQPISADESIVMRFTRNCDPATPYNPDPTRVFDTVIITSDLDQELLPLVRDSNCSKICDISSDLSSVPLSMFKLKNRHFWNRRPKYHRIEYIIKVIVGPADLRFELWHNSMRISNGNPIRVEWSAAEPPPVTTPRETFPEWHEPAQEPRATRPEPMNGQPTHFTFRIPRRPFTRRE